MFLSAMKIFSLLIYWIRGLLLSFVIQHGVDLNITFWTFRFPKYVK